MRPSFPSLDRLVIVGAGPMGHEHVRAALAVGLDPKRILVVARTSERARALAESTGVGWRAGGIEKLRDAPQAAVVAVGVEDLAPVGRVLVDLGCPLVLLEKPGAFSRGALSMLHVPDRKIFVGLNRRFYPSVDAARHLIEEDGGPLSASFDFTEIEARVLAERHPPHVLRRWGIVNSLHVIDLFRHLVGHPTRLVAERAGSLSWHPAGAVFAGYGMTERDALFSYVATWGGAGRWSLEVTTAERKLILRPLEQLRVQRRGGFAVEPVELSPEPTGVKPGLAGQLAAFLARVDGGDGCEGGSNLCGLADAEAVYALTETIVGYGEDR